MKKLKIMQIAPFAFPIGESSKYGGIEKVVRDLDKEFTRQGHESLVVATENSSVYGTLCPTFSESLWKIQQNKQDGHKYKKDNFNYDEKREEHSSKALDYILTCKPDIVHDHLGFIKTKIFKNSKNLPPILYTLHDPIDQRSKEKLDEVKKIKSVFFNAISRSQKAFFSDYIDVDYMVYNGVDVKDYPYSREGKGFIFSLGLVNKPKGTDIVLDTAKEAQMKVVLAGPVLTGKIHNKNRMGAIGDFWEEEIKPRLDLILDKEISPQEVGKFVDEFMESKYNSAYIGELDDAQKKEWYKRASCFSFPIRRQEPFGLVMIESMACGTPVVAYSNGAVPEIVKDGETGWIVEPDFKGIINDATGHYLESTGRGIKDFAKSLSRVNKISRKACRNYIEKNFTIRKQAKEYLEVYNNIINKIE